MKIQFLGGAREVGRSCVLVETRSDRVLFDYGVKLSEGQQPLYPGKINGTLDGIILSHAHLDHSGHVPAWFANSKTLLFATQPTVDLANLLWADSLKIAEYEDYHAPYLKGHINKTNKNTYIIPHYKKEIPIADESMLTFFDAGHIPGSAMCYLNTNEKNLLYTGDINFGETNLLKPAEIPDKPVDVMMVESTYAGKEHPKREKTEKTFAESVKSHFETGGHPLIASFAIGRAQEIMMIFKKYNIDAPIYLDGMAQKATMAIQQSPKFVKDSKALNKAVQDVTFVKSQKMRQEIIKEPGLIITTAGMLQGGPILYYLLELNNNPLAKLFLTGYQVEGTNGRKILNDEPVEIDEVELPLKIAWEHYDLSAHADWPQLQKLVKKMNPEILFCMHGQEANCELFANWAKEELGIDAYAPMKNESFSF
ncbi:MAG: MBL fold metallo-hydrolase [Candidatus Diapherotrites archaeon]|nr:MBL fold metallo-hydrolase [Candidatus Diapherotrites archaeon]